MLYTFDRTSVIGSDLNQCWTLSAVKHPELVAVKQTVQQIAQTYGEEVDVYIDLHAHTCLLGACIYGVCRDDVFHMERHALFPKLLSLRADDFYIDNTVYCKETYRTASSTRSYRIIGHILHMDIPPEVMHLLSHSNDGTVTPDDYKLKNPITSESIEPNVAQNE
ncbi:unnamed protein product [Medioppia subpectinata]|uniref:Uncharacterized protein n=1 Tax=Medioppia subpectinata TaxID=1979941 RepID=A0A7R9KNM3_9ACAR|nr:unnamed protein product [Medioppia subpectinata]CAG2106873.1 unnamed protein product [Medioppia subpectinata]